MVIIDLTRNQVVAQAARGFESHPVRQYLATHFQKNGLSFLYKQKPQTACLRLRLTKIYNRVLPFLP